LILAHVSPDLLVAVVLRSVGRDKIGVIKAVRCARPEFGLAEAKHFVENVPQVLVKATPATEARRIVDELTQIGAVADITSSHYATS
jgi:ribosomal protein L7/L12